jgi:uncharacterized protein (DUF58 family)
MFGFKRRRRTRITKTGGVFVLFILLLQLAAFNTGENLFYMVTSGVISFFIVGWLGSGYGIRSVSLHRQAPDAVHRGDSFGSILRLTNKRRFCPLIDISINSSQWQESVLVSWMPVRSVVEFRAYEAMPARGVHPLPPIRVETTFPFGLLERSLTIDDRETILVYPRVFPLSKGLLDDLEDSGQAPKASFNDGDEFFSLREYIPGDDIRHISWKVSARLGKLIIRELEPSISRMVILVLDTRGIPETDDDRESFEMAMDLAASLAVSLLDLHFVVGLETPGESVSLGRGPVQITKILEALAVANAVSHDDYGDDWWQSQGQQAEASRILLSGDPSQWGVMNLSGRGRVLDPREVLRG